VRIIAGLHRSRVIDMVGVDTTRETTDKVRGAIFNLICSYQITGNGLDLFSGSGAMGLEALSRGLDFCYFNDLNKKAFLTTKKNIHSLNYDNNTKVFNLDYKACLKLIDKKLNFVFLDPPYALEETINISKYLIEENMLADNALIICEVSKDIKYEVPNGLELYKERDYGIRKIIILRKRGTCNA